MPKSRTNEAEFFALTNPANATSFFSCTISNAGGNLLITVPTQTGRLYRLQQSSSLGAWQNTPNQVVLSGNGQPQMFTVPALPGEKQFYQVAVALP